MIPYATIYKEIFNLHKRFGQVHPQDRDKAYWDDAAEAFEALSLKHGDRFVDALLAAILGELLEEHKEYMSLQILEHGEGQSLH